MFYNMNITRASYPSLIVFGIRFLFVFAMVIRKAIFSRPYHGKKQLSSLHHKNGNVLRYIFCYIWV
ncbi:MAG: hypothetical protein CVU06_01840 [Bacteroidetes bacterium HGW-Bacteroidetes-22]|nr:MAG: hypothetical protein CVU06_01840 [Bacteroidetes bacterium HGW-Bacteroidetes-22]